MVKIEVSPYRITAKGHAGFDKSGRDVVCAAVSALIQALALGLERVRHLGGLDAFLIEISDGAALLSALPRTENEREVRLLFDVFATALLQIARDYPEYVEVRPIAGDSM